MALHPREMGAWDWVTSNHPRVMLTFLRGHVSERKRRLFACACCHMVRHLIVDERSWHAVQLAERHADGLATAAELDAAAEIANGIWLDMADRVRKRAGEAAFQCAMALPEELWQLDWTWAAAALAIEGHALETSSTLTPDETQRMLDSWEEAWGGSGEPMGWTEPDPSAEMANVLRCIFGNPFRPRRSIRVARHGRRAGAGDLRRPRVRPAADPGGRAAGRGLRQRRPPHHCRDAGPHARGCWVVDLVLGVGVGRHSVTASRDGVAAYLACGCRVVDLVLGKA